MNIWNVLTGGIIGEVGEAIDRNVTSDEERLTLKNEFERIISKREGLALEAEKMTQENVTARHAADMASDNKLSKNIRPGSLITLITLTVLWAIVGIFILDDPPDGIALTESIKFKAWLAVLALLEVLDLLAFGFYFGGRSIEKSAGKITALLMARINKK